MTDLNSKLTSEMQTLVKVYTGYDNNGDVDVIAVS